MEHSGNIPIFNVPGTLFWGYSPEFHRELFIGKYIRKMFHEYSTKIYLVSGKVASFTKNEYSYLVCSL